jgi:nucleoside-diphosphate-sugar epimerase
VSGRLFNWLVSGRLRLPGGGRAPRTFLAAADLGRAFHAAAERGQPGVAYLLGGIRGSWRELLLAAAKLLDVRPHVGRASYDLSYLAAAAGMVRTELGRWCWPTPFVVDALARPQLVDDGWSRRELSWEPQVRTFTAGLTGLREWYRPAARAAEADRAAWGDAPQRRLTS